MATQLLIGFALALAGWLNRRGRVTTAGYLMLGGVTVAMGMGILLKGVLTVQGVDLGDYPLPLYDLFVVPIVLAGVLISRRAPLILCGATGMFTFLSLILMPKSPPFQSYWDGAYLYSEGNAVAAVLYVLLVQRFTAVASWLCADSLWWVLFVRHAPTN